MRDDASEDRSGRNRETQVVDQQSIVVTLADILKVDDPIAVDGRRVLINPKKALEGAMKAKV